MLGHQRRLQLAGTGNKADRVPPDRADHRPEGDGRQRPGDGLRQHGRQLGHRRRLHPRPEHRRERLLRRLPDQRPGRGRRRRHPHPRADQPSSTSEMPKVYEQLMDIRQKLETALQGDAGHRVHGAGRHALHAPDPHRQADRHRRRADRRRDGQGEADRRDDRRQAGQPGQPQPPAPAAARPEGEGQAGRPGDRRQPRRGVAARSILSAEAAVEHAEKHPNDPILLVRKETSPEDVAGMHLAKGILTAPAARRATRPSSPAAGASPASSAARRSRSTRRPARSRSPARSSRPATSSRSTARPATS